MYLRRKNNQVLLVILLCLAMFIYQFSDYTQEDIASGLEYINIAYHYGTYSFANLIKHRNNRNQLVFPKSFPVSQQELPRFVKGFDSIDMVDLKHPKPVKPSESNSLLTEGLINSNYFSHPLKVFHDQEDITLADVETCKSHLEMEAKVEVDTPVSLDTSMPEILQRFIDDLDTNPFYHEMAPLFLKDAKIQLKNKVVDQYWYKLAGSSVWLEEYQVHFMISRILYTFTHIRNQPRVSFFYAQLYDKDWNELTNTKLVVPTNDLNEDSKNHKDNSDKQHYKVLKFPYFLPIPFYHKYDDTWGRYYGPEDPRILMVKNKAGYEEPLIAFNLYHQKKEYDEKEGKEVKKHYRNMFISWPWQFQKGKANMDGFNDPQYENNYYNKAVELKIKNVKRKDKQKNWTPFVSNSDRNRHGYDKTLNFIYRWADFEVLKCDITKDIGTCTFNYRLNPELKSNAGVGPLRGGTELININSLLGEDAKKVIPSNREILVGFARAHIDNCGCGENMYRPNLVVVTKDTLNPATNNLNAKREAIEEFGGPMREEEIQQKVNDEKSNDEQITEEEQKLLQEEEKKAEVQRQREMEEKQAEDEEEKKKEEKQKEEQEKKKEEEKKKTEEEKEHIEIIDYEDTYYKISYISSFISFNIPIIGWNLLDPNNVCDDGPNILIPNGISNWVVSSKNGEDFEDYLTLSVSLSDFTNHKINIKGLLGEILRINNGNIATEVINSDNLVGFNNDNLNCAIELSKQFCHDFGVAHGAEDKKKEEKKEGEEEKKPVDIPKYFNTPELKSRREIELFNPEQILSYQLSYPIIGKYEHALDEFNRNKNKHKINDD